MFLYDDTQFIRRFWRLAKPIHTKRGSEATKGSWVEQILYMLLSSERAQLLALNTLNNRSHIAIATIPLILITQRTVVVGFAIIKIFVFEVGFIFIVKI